MSKISPNQIRTLPLTLGGTQGYNILSPSGSLFNFTLTKRYWVKRSSASTYRCAVRRPSTGIVARLAFEAGIDSYAIGVGQNVDLAAT